MVEGMAGAADGAVAIETWQETFSQFSLLTQGTGSRQKAVQGVG